MSFYTCRKKEFEIYNKAISEKYIPFSLHLLKLNIRLLIEELQIRRYSSKTYHVYIVVDPHGFQLCLSLFPNISPIYYSLELYVGQDLYGVDYPESLKEFEQKNINNIQYLWIQSPEREELFRDFYSLNDSIPTLFLPVTYRGDAVDIKSRYLHHKYSISIEKKIILHLGGIAEWFSCFEFSYRMKDLDDYVLIFHGHSAARQRYFQ